MLVEVPKTGDGQFKCVGPGKYVKWNPVLGIRTILLVEPSTTPGKVNVHVRYEQEVSNVLDFNLHQQNEFRGFKGMDGYVGVRIPIVERNKVMEKCGFKPGQGYDEKKFKQIVNDRDFYKFKTVPGKI
jgi:hypothetical protein